MIRQLITAVSVGLLSTSGALAADHEVSFEVSSLVNNSDSYNVFSGGRQGMTALGVRGGWAFHDRLALIGGFQHHRRGSEVYLQESEASMVAAYFATTYSVGIKADIEPVRWLQLYTTAQASLYQGLMKWDNEPDSRTNLGQLQSSGISGGGVFAGGVEFRIPKGLKLPVGFGFYTEMGYGIIARHSYNNPKDPNAPDMTWEDGQSIGTMQPGGFTIRSGIGVRF